MDYLIQDSGKKNIAYRSLVVKDPSILGTLSNGLSLKILKGLVETPSCAMDLARKLKQHEQKIYYHLRNLQRAGLIELVGTEERLGGTAKMYGVSYQAVSLKLMEKGQEIPDVGLDEFEFLKPFIEDGELNAKIIVGDTYSHGKYDVSATEGSYIIDTILLLGKFTKISKFPSYKLDTTIDEDELKDNLILFGNYKTNTIIDKMNSNLPVYFDTENGNMISKLTKKVYNDPRMGAIIKCLNPYDNTKKILVFCGIGRRGVQSTAIAFTQHMNKISENPKKNGDIIKVVKGFDANGDNIIDSVKFLE